MCGSFHIFHLLSYRSPIDIGVSVGKEKRSLVLRCGLNLIVSLGPWIVNFCSINARNMLVFFCGF